MLGGGLRALALAVILAGCALSDAGQSTGGTTPTTGAGGSAGGGDGGAGGGGGGGIAGPGGASSVSSATGGAASTGIGGGGGAGGAVPCANSADCGGLTCCQTFEGARPVYTCIVDAQSCTPNTDGGVIQCASDIECVNGDICCDDVEGSFCAGISGCPGG